MRYLEREATAAWSGSKSHYAVASPWHLPGSQMKANRRSLCLVLLRESGALTYILCKRLQNSGFHFQESEKVLILKSRRTGKRRTETLYKLQVYVPRPRFNGRQHAWKPRRTKPN